METADKLLREQLKSLMDQAEINAKLQQQLDNVVDPMLKGSIHVATFSYGCLTVIANNASIATRFRFIEAELVSQLQATHLFKELKTLTCKVRPAQAEETERTVERHISSDNASMIKQAAEYIKDERIKKALEHLASKE